MGDTQTAIIPKINQNTEFSDNVHIKGTLDVDGKTTIKKDLQIKGEQSNGNYGGKLNFGDGDNVHLYEDTDNHLEIKGTGGIKLAGATTITENTTIGANTNKKNLTVNGDITADNMQANKIQTKDIDITDKLTIKNGNTTFMQAGCLPKDINNPNGEKEYRVEVNGGVGVKGLVATNIIKSQGNIEAQGDISAKTLKVNETLDIKGSVSIGEYDTYNGNIDVYGNAQVENLFVAGNQTLEYDDDKTNGAIYFQGKISSIEDAESIEHRQCGYLDINAQKAIRLNADVTTDGNITTQKTLSCGELIIPNIESQSDGGIWREG